MLDVKCKYYIFIQKLLERKSILFHIIFSSLLNIPILNMCVEHILNVSIFFYLWNKLWVLLCELENKLLLKKVENVSFFIVCYFYFP